MRRANWVLAAIAVSVVLVPVLYLLSVGPAAAIYARHWISDDVYYTYCLPLGLIPGNDSDWHFQALNEYVALWLRTTEE